MTLKTLLYNIAQYAMTNKIINYSAAGPSLYQLNMETIKDYPILFASPTGNHNITPNLTTYTITLYYIDRLTRGGDNDIDILSSSVEGLKSIINGIKYLPGVIEVYDDYNITNFADTQKMSDNVAGAYATITIRTANNSTCPDGIITDDSKNKAPVLFLIDGTKLAGSKFKKIPNSYKFSNISNFDNMFEGCTSLEIVNEIDTSRATTMAGMFYGCGNLQTVVLDTPRVLAMPNMFWGCGKLQTIDIDTKRVSNMNGMFYYCSSLETIPLLDTSSLYDARQMFAHCTSLTSVPEINTKNTELMAGMFNDCPSLQTLPAFNSIKVRSIGNYFWKEMENLTDVGGWINLKCNWNDDYGLILCPNLTYQSCINILNGLYDFTGNGKTPASNQGQLKVHPNFLDLVGDEISIATEKGWFILQ